jgi:hypothetical protein
MLESANCLVSWLYCESIPRLCAGRASVECPLAVLDLRRGGDVLLETPHRSPSARGLARS